MRKTIILTLSLLLGLGICATGAWAYDFPDTTKVERYNGSIASGEWTDVVGLASEYDILGGNLVNDGGNYHLVIYTNWNPFISHGPVHTADLFLDTDMDGDWDAVVVLDTNRVAGTVYYNPTSITTSQDLFSGMEHFLYGGMYDEAAPKEVPVLGTSDDTGLTTVLWTLGLSGDPNTVDILLSGIEDFDPLTFQYLLASATCANDVAQGGVPIPGTVMLLGSGLLGMAGLGWRRVWKQG